MSSKHKTRLSPEEYLALERQAAVRSEYIDGDMVAMSGGSRNHNLIVTNLVRQISLDLKGRPYEVYPSNMRVKVSPTGLYTYPDVVVVRGEPEFEDVEVDTLLNPVLLAEVLSDSTASYDRITKFGHYRKIESKIEYLLVSQRTCSIEQFVRQATGPWSRREIRGLEGVLDLQSIPCRLQLAEVYDRVRFRSDSPEP